MTPAAVHVFFPLIPVAARMSINYAKFFGAKIKAPGLNSAAFVNLDYIAKA